MSWSQKLLDVAGNTLRLHVTFPLLLLWVAMVNWPDDGT
jgi:hypothetical protein